MTDSNVDSMNLLISMGFPMEECKTALEISNGNMEHALNFLLSSSEDTANNGMSGTTASAASNITPIKITTIIGTMNQYTVPNGRSACTCMALYGAEQILSSLDVIRSTSSDDDTCWKKCNDHLRNQVMTNEFLTSIIVNGSSMYEKYSTMRSSSYVEHTSVEEIMDSVRTTSNSDLIPTLVRLYESSNIHNGVLTSADEYTNPFGLYYQLEDLYLNRESSWMCIVVTKTPETILLLFPPAQKQKQTYSNQFILMDTHPRRAQYPDPSSTTSPTTMTIDNAYIRVHASLLELYQQSLRHLFPPPPPSSSGSDMMMELYNSFDLYPFYL